LSSAQAIRTTGIVVALASEAGTLGLRTAKPGRITALNDGAALQLCGMGPAAARHAAEMLADAGAAALAVFGVAGALAPQLRNGALFCPERVLDEDGHTYGTDMGWRIRLQQQLDMPFQMQGALLSVASPLLTAASKTGAYQQYGALAVDMESAAVAAVAQQRGLPFLVLRAIIDECTDTIPAALDGSVDAWGRPRLLRLLAAICRHPSLCGELPRLYSRMQTAIQALRAAATAAGPSLGWHR